MGPRPAVAAGGSTPAVPVSPRETRRAVAPARPRPVPSTPIDALVRVKPCRARGSLWPGRGRGGKRAVVSSDLVDAVDGLRVGASWDGWGAGWDSAGPPGDALVLRAFRVALPSSTPPGSPPGAEPESPSRTRGKSHRTRTRIRGAHLPHHASGLLNPHAPVALRPQLVVIGPDHRGPEFRRRLQGSQRRRGARRKGPRPLRGRAQPALKPAELILGTIALVFGYFCLKAGRGSRRARRGFGTGTSSSARLLARSASPTRPSRACDGTLVNAGAARGPEIGWAARASEHTPNKRGLWLPLGMLARRPPRPPPPLQTRGNRSGEGSKPRRGGCVTTQRRDLRGFGVGRRMV